MSILLTKILWYSIDSLSNGKYSNPTNITDSVNFNVSRGLDIKNNTLDMDLKNKAQKFDSNENIVNRYIDATTFKTVFQENDQIKVYIRYTDDMSVVESSEWEDNDVEPSSDYLLGVFFVTDYKLKEGQKGQSISIVCVDKTAVIFNKLLAKAFPQESTSGTITSTSSNKLIDSGASFTSTANPSMRVTNTTSGSSTFITNVDSDTILSLNDDIFTSGDDYNIEWTAPSIIQKVVRFTSESQNGIKDGSGNDSGVSYDIDAKTVSEGGYIQDERRDTTEDGSSNTDRAFPATSLSKVWKPVYEWIGELSETDYINDLDERDGTDPIVYGRSFLYWIDEDNQFHWVENSQTVDTIIDIDTDEEIYSLSLNYTVFDSINFIVYRGGEDFYGTGTLGYKVDDTAGAKNLKMRVVAMTDIAKNLIEEEISTGNITEDNSTPGEFTFSGNRYTATFPVTASWNSTSYTNASDYNNALRDEIDKRASNRANNYLAGLTGQRYKGSMEKKGEILTPGTLYNITDRDTGVVSENIRVTEVHHNITKEGWFITVSLEQDADAIL